MADCRGRGRAPLVARRVLVALFSGSANLEVQGGGRWVRCASTSSAFAPLPTLHGPCGRPLRSATVFMHDYLTSPAAQLVISLLPLVEHKHHPSAPTLGSFHLLEAVASTPTLSESV